MPRTCSVCVHAGRSAVEAALSAGHPVRAIASRFGLSRSAVSRHRVLHVSGRGTAGPPLEESRHSATRREEPRHSETPAQLGEPKHSETAESSASNAAATTATVKRYRCSRWPELAIGDSVRFKGGAFQTADPDLQALLESRPYYGVQVVEEGPNP